MSDALPFSVSASSVAALVGELGLTAAWQGLEIALVVYLGLRLAGPHRWSARTRYSVWWVTLAAALVTPAVTLSGRVLARQSTAPANFGAGADDFTPGRIVFRQRIAMASDGSSIATVRPDDAPLRVAPLVLAIAIGGAAVTAIILLARVLSGLHVVSSLKRRSAPISDDLRVLLEARFPTAGVPGSRSVDVRVADDLGTPVAVGFRRPAIIFPRWLIAQLDRERLTHVYGHELAHLQRYDDWAKLALRVIQALGWWLPGVHLAARRLELEQELACDEWAVGNARVRPQAYASSLVEIGALALGAGSAKRVALVPSAATALRKRVDALLAMPPAPFGRERATRRLTAACAPLGAVALAAMYSPSFVVSTAPRASVSGSPAVATAPVSPTSTPVDGRDDPPRTRAPRPAQAATIDASTAELESLIRLLGDRDPETRARAAFAIGSHRAAALPATSALIELLADTARIDRESDATSVAWWDGEDRAVTSPAEEAAKAILFIGKPALPVVEQAASRMDGRAPARFAWMLGLLRRFD